MSVIAIFFSYTPVSAGIFTSLFVSRRQMCIKNSTWGVKTPTAKSEPRSSASSAQISATNQRRSRRSKANGRHSLARSRSRLPIGWPACPSRTRGLPQRYSYLILHLHGALQEAGFGAICSEPSIESNQTQSNQPPAASHIGRLVAFPRIM